MKKELVIKEANEIYEVEALVKKIVEAIGHEDAFVTEFSPLSDFTIGLSDQESDEAHELMIEQLRALDIHLTLQECFDFPIYEIAKQKLGLPFEADGKKIWDRFIAEAKENSQKKHTIH